MLVPQLYTTPPHMHEEKARRPIRGQLSPRQLGEATITSAHLSCISKSSARTSKKMQSLTSYGLLNILRYPTVAREVFGWLYMPRSLPAPPRLSRLLLELTDRPHYRQNRLVACRLLPHLLQLAQHSKDGSFFVSGLGSVSVARTGQLR